MKTVEKLLMVLTALWVMTSLTACNDTDDGSFVKPITQYEKIGGHWVLNSITQIDELTSTSMTLTNQFEFDSFAINLNTDGDFQPTTFSVEGTAPELLPTQGTWRLANPYVNSDGSSARILLNDATELTVTAVPGVSQTLEFKLTRKVNGQPFVSYVYSLIPVVE